MYKNLLLIFVAATFLLACGGQATTSQDEQAEAIIDEPVVVALADFNEKAESLVGKEIYLEGMVIHVCRHGGKKMFITADDPEVRIKITPAEETEAFNVELEGNYIKVRGVVEAMEVEVAEEGEKHEEDEDHANYYHKPQYSVACFEYTVKEDISQEE